MLHSLEFGSKKIDFSLQFSNRKTLGIKVLPDATVSVIAPKNAEMQKILDTVKKKAMWILKQQTYFLNFNPITLDYVIKSGYSVHYLGRQYKLLVEKAEKDDVFYKGNLFQVEVKDKKNAKNIFDNWLKQRAKDKIVEIAEPLIKKFEKKYKAPSEIYFQEMPTRWGSCTVKNRLILNPKLIHTPKRCIEYVVMHELCHLVYKHHNNDFFDLLSLMMPDWEKRKEKLDTFL
jgi:predicted metal-dependent hydrolase